MTDRKVAFEFVEHFDYLKLKNCVANEKVFSRPFVSRHGDFAFKWKLNVTPKRKRDAEEAFKFSLCWDDDNLQDTLYADFDLFAGNNKGVVRSATDEKFDNKTTIGLPAFLPSVTTLEEKGLVVDNVVKMGVKMVLKESDFDPLRWLPIPSLTPSTGLGVQFFNNLNTDSGLGTDFVLVVGRAKTELRVNRLALTAVPFFHRMFGNEVWTANQDGALQLPMYTVDAVIEALRFIYLNAIGEDLTRFLPSILALASEWELNHLKTAIERDMVQKLQANRLNAQYNIAADNLRLATKFDRKVVRRLVIFKLIDAWPQFRASPTGERMRKGSKVLMCELTTMMQAAAVCGGVSV